MHPDEGLHATRGLVRVAAILLALLVLPVGVARADVDLDAEIARLVGPDATVRSAAYSTLSRANDPAVIPKLVPRLAEADDIAQYYGVLLIQRHPKEGRPALETLAASRSPHLRVVAGAALWRMGDRKAGATIVQALAAEDVPDTQRATMLMRLYNVTAPDVMEAVRGHLRKDGAATVVQAAIYNVYIGKDRAALSALEGLDEHAQSGVRAMAGACRIALGDVGGADTMAAAFGAGGIDTSALSRIRSMLDQVRPVPTVVLEAIHAAMQAETSPYALRMLVELLGMHGHAKATKDIRALLDHADGTVAKAAFEALARLPGGVNRDTMRKLLDGGDDARRLAAAEALRRADDDVGFAVVVEILKEGSTIQVRWDAARALAGYRRAEAVAPLLAALDDGNSTVRSHAWSSLGSVLRTLFPYRRLDLNSLGYAATDPAPRRKAVVDRLKAWWARHEKADW